MTDARDILLLAAEWPTRALLRAQLLEDGHGVVAVDAWPVARMSFQQPAPPRAVIVDLQGLADPHHVVTELPVLITPDRVLVVTALGSVLPEDLRRRGFHLVLRPTSVGEIAAAARHMLTDVQR